MAMKLATIELRLIDAAVQFGRNEKALRDERRAEREHDCAEPRIVIPDPSMPYIRSTGVSCCNADLSQSDWCENCRIKMALRENRTGNRRLRQLAKERIVRLARLMDAAKGGR